MEWYEKYKVGDKVKVVKKVSGWNYGHITKWAYIMNKTIGEVYEIVEIDKIIGYRLHTQLDAGGMLYDYWYPEESLKSPIKVGQQLLFDFM